LKCHKSKKHEEFKAFHTKTVGRGNWAHVVYFLKTFWVIWLMGLSFVARRRTKQQPGSSIDAIAVIAMDCR
jgi:hypothetical protein